VVRRSRVTFSAPTPLAPQALKNHAGGGLNANPKRRYFVSDGYYVGYYTDDSMTKRTGKFDLRNISKISAPKDSDNAPGGVAIDVADRQDKRLVVSFDNEAEGEIFKQMWCSAVSQDELDASLVAYHSSTLNKEYASTHASQVWLACIKAHNPSSCADHAFLSCLQARATSKGSFLYSPRVTPSTTPMSTPRPYEPVADTAPVSKKTATASTPRPPAAATQAASKVPAPKAAPRVDVKVRFVVDICIGR